MTVMVILILWVYKPRRLSKLKMTENDNFFYAFAANLGFIEIPTEYREHFVQYRVANRDASYGDR